MRTDDWARVVLVEPKKWLLKRNRRRAKRRTPSLSGRFSKQYAFSQKEKHLSQILIIVTSGVDISVIRVSLSQGLTLIGWNF